MREISEISYSLQREGFHTDTPAVFIRFSGCSLKCSFYDIQHEEKALMSDGRISDTVGEYPATTMTLMSGEPPLWIDREFVDRLHRIGKYVCIETSGTHALPDDTDWVTCSPKQGARSVISRIDEVKIVYEGQDIIVYESLPAEHSFLQPCPCSSIAKAVACVM